MSSTYCTVQWRLQITRLQQPVRIEDAPDQRTSCAATQGIKHRSAMVSDVISHHVLSRGSHYVLSLVINVFSHNSHHVLSCSSHHVLSLGSHHVYLVAAIMSYLMAVIMSYLVAVVMSSTSVPDPTLDECSHRIRIVITFPLPCMQTCQLSRNGDGSAQNLWKLLWINIAN